MVHGTALENLSEATMTQIAVQWHVAMCVVLHTHSPVAFELHWLSVGNSGCWLLPFMSYGLAPQGTTCLLPVQWDQRVRLYFGSCWLSSVMLQDLGLCLLGDSSCYPSVTCPPDIHTIPILLIFCMLLKTWLSSLGLRCGWVPLIFDSVF